MNSEPQGHGPSADELARWITTSGESDFVDAKGPMAWDRADASASLAKDIASFANSRDGGIIVVGKSEAADGSFSYTGLTPEQAASFDTTNVGQWVNARFSPPIRLACYQADFDSRRYVVIVVQEFDDVPSICVKNYQEAVNPKNHLLREGSIYVRNQIAESKPIMTPDELRALIGLATRKKGNELIAHFQAMLRGRSLADFGPTPDLFEQEIRQVQSELKFNEAVGGWWMSFHPRQHIGDRWATTDEMERLIAAYSVHVIDEFPGHQRGTFRMGWGIGNDYYGETWALRRSGLFCYWDEFRENRERAEHTGYRGSRDKSAIPPGGWVEYSWSIRRAVDYFMFLGRFVDVYGPGQDIRINIRAGPLAGRKLVALDTRTLLGYGDPEPCRAPYFTFDKTVEAESLRASWGQLCVEALKEFVDLFPGLQIGPSALISQVERYKARQF